MTEPLSNVRKHYLKWLKALFKNYRASISISTNIVDKLKEIYSRCKRALYQLIAEFDQQKLALAKNIAPVPDDKQVHEQRATNVETACQNLINNIRSAALLGDYEMQVEVNRVSKLKPINGQVIFGNLTNLEPNIELLLANLLESLDEILTEGDLVKKENIYLTAFRNAIHEMDIYSKEWAGNFSAGLKIFDNKMDKCYKEYICDAGLRNQLESIRARFNDKSRETNSRVEIFKESQLSDETIDQMMKMETTEAKNENFEIMKQGLIEKYNYALEFVLEQPEQVQELIFLHFSFNHA